MSDIQINHHIPRTMTIDGLQYLGRIARSVPKNGTIVEIGPLYGSSTWVLAKNAHPSVSIYSIDTWEPKPWIEKKFPHALPFGLGAFHAYIGDCPNVTAIKGWSPDIVSDWDRPIDMLFDDATHGDPGFSHNIEFFSRFITTEGIICGDDFASGWPDIVRVVNKLAKSWDVAPEVRGRVWAMVNKGGSNNTSARVADRIGPWGDYDLVCKVGDSAGQTWTSTPTMWAGPMHQKIPLHTAQFAFASYAQPVDVLVQYRMTNGSLSDWISGLENYTSDVPINSLRAMLPKSEGLNRDIRYQLCEIDNKGKTKNSANASGGSWVSVASDSAVCGIRADIIETSPH